MEFGLPAPDSVDVEGVVALSDLLTPELKGLGLGYAVAEIKISHTLGP